MGEKKLRESGILSQYLCFMVINEKSFHDGTNLVELYDISR